MLRPCSHFLQRTAWLGSPGLPRPGTPLTGAQSCGKRVAVTLRCQCCHAGHGASQRSGHSLRTQAQRPGPRHRRLLSLWGYGRCLAPGWDHGVGKNTALRAGGPRGPLPTASQTLGGREVSSPRASARGRRPGWAVVGFSDGPVVTLTPSWPSSGSGGGKGWGLLAWEGALQFRGDSRLARHRWELGHGHLPPPGVRAREGLRAPGLLWQGCWTQSVPAFFWPEHGSAPATRSCQTQPGFSLVLGRPCPSTGSESQASEAGWWLPLVADVACVHTGWGTGQPGGGRPWRVLAPAVRPSVSCGGPAWPRQQVSRVKLWFSSHEPRGYEDETASRLPTQSPGPAVPLDRQTVG